MPSKLNVTAKKVLVFLSLLFICHELHELVHTTIAYLQCGCWGQRDFNVWQVCASCSPAVNTIWATVAGPLFTYLLIMGGWLLMRKGNTVAQQSVGFALVWANVPVARLITVLMKGGDEGVIIRKLIGTSTIPVTIWAIEIAVVLLLIMPSFIRAWRLLVHPRKVGVFVAFLIGPMLIEYAAMHKLGNTLLLNGVLDEQGLLGSPVLVNIWNGIWLMVLLLGFSQLTRLFLQQEQPVKKAGVVMENI